MKAFFISIGNLVGLISAGTTTQLAIDSIQADVIKELGFGESLVMLILTALLAIIIIICGFLYYLHRVFQIFKNTYYCAAWSNRLFHNGRKQKGKSYDVNPL